MTFVVIWAVVAVPLICASVFMCGMEQNEEPLVPMVACIAIWPLVICLIALAFPFWIIWKAGHLYSNYLDRRARERTP